MSLLPIVFGVDRTTPISGKGVALANPDPAFQNLKQKILERDQNMCQFCGFAAPKYHDIVFRNGNKKDHSDANVATACIFCHQCFHLERVGPMNSGSLVWLPEISQAQLNHIMRAVYVARRTQGPMADAARAALAVLGNRKEDAKQRLGTDSPAVLAGVMQDLMSPGMYKLRARKLAGFRLLPNDRRIVVDDDLEFDQFPQILAHWRSRNGPYGSMLPPTWPQLHRTILGAA